MATPSGLGVSTGIGKGEAQVFTPVESDYYKNKANLALKEKAAQEKAFVDIGSAPVFNPDTEEYKQELAKVRQFYRDNQRSILEGDFDTKLKLNQLTSGLTQWAANSNAEGKVWEALKKKAATDENSIYQKDLDDLTKYYNTSYSKRRGMDLKLRGRFDKKKFLDEGIAEINKLPYDPATLRIEQIKQADGTIKEVIVNEQNQPVSALDDIVSSGYSSAELEYGKDQVGNSVTMKEYKDFLKPYIGSKRSISQITERDPYSNTNPGPEQNYGWELNSQLIESTIPFMKDENEMVLQEDQAVIFGNLGIVTPVKVGLSTNNQYTPISGEVEIDDPENEGEYITREVKRGSEWSSEIEAQAKKQAANIVDFNIKSVKVAPVFQEGATGIKNNKLNLAGRLVPAAFLNDDGSLKHYYKSSDKAKQIDLWEKYGNKIKYEGRAFLKSAKSSGHVPASSVANQLRKYKPWKAGAEAEMEKRIEEMNSIFSQGLDSSVPVKTNSQDPNEPGITPIEKIKRQAALKQ